MIRISQNRVEIDYGVERAAGPDPFVNRLPDRFLGFRVVARNVYAFKRRERGANHLDPVSVSAGNQLAVRGDQVLSGANIGWIGQDAPAQPGAGETYVIYPFEQYDVRYALQRQDVPVEAGQGAGAVA